MKELESLLLSDNGKTPESIIDDVMGRSEFHGSDPVNIDWLKEFINKFFDLLGDIFNKVAEWIGKIIDFLGLGNNKGGSSLKVGTIVGIIFGVILIALIIFLIVKVVIYFSKKGFPRREKDDLQEELIQYAENPGEPYNISKKFYEENNMRMAFRFLFISMLVKFNKKEVIFISKSKTNRTYRSEISKAGRNISAFSDPFFDEFDLLWYGGRSLSRSEMDSWYEKFDAFFGDFDKIKTIEEKNDEKA